MCVFGFYWDAVGTGLRGASLESAFEEGALRFIGSLFVWLVCFWRGPLLSGLHHWSWWGCIDSVFRSCSVVSSVKRPQVQCLAVMKYSVRSSGFLAFNAFTCSIRSGHLSSLVTWLFEPQGVHLVVCVLHSLLKWCSLHFAQTGEGALHFSAVWPYCWHQLHVPGLLTSLVN